MAATNPQLIYGDMNKMRNKLLMPATITDLFFDDKPKQTWKLYYPVSHIYTQTNRHKDKPDKYYPLYSEILRSTLGWSYKTYLRQLLNDDILQCDRWFIPQLKPLGYRLKKSLMTDDSYYYRITNNNICKKLAEEWARRRNITYDSPVVQYLHECDLRVCCAIDEYTKYDPKHNILIGSCSRYIIECLNNNGHHTKHSKKVHRFYNTWFNIKREFRYLLLVDNKNLCCVDLSSSHLLFLHKLLMGIDPKYFAHIFFDKIAHTPKDMEFIFCGKNQKAQIFIDNDILSISNISKSIQPTPILIDMYMWHKNWGFDSHQFFIETNKLKDMVRAGTVYEYISQYCPPFKDRKDMKKKILGVLYRRPVAIETSDYADATIAWWRAFPNIMMVVEGIKLQSIKGGSKVFSWTIQRLEAEWLLNCCRQIHREKPNLWLSSLMDAIYTNEPDELAYIESVMGHQLNRINCCGRFKQTIETP